MSKFEVPIVRITDVRDHPDPETTRLSIVYFRGFGVVSGKLDDGSHRYQVGDLVAYCPQDSVLPEGLLKQGFWRYDVIRYPEGSADNVTDFTAFGGDLRVKDYPRELVETPGSTLTVDGMTYRVLESGQGLLDGSNHNRVKPKKLRGFVSEGIMFPVEQFGDADDIRCYVGRQLIGHYSPTWGGSDEQFVGMDVAETLGVTKYEPEIPTKMAGDVAYIGHLTPNFDIENIKKFNYILDGEEEVVVTEKLHGTCSILAKVMTLNHPDFPEKIFAGSKGLAAKGIVIKNNEKNVDNLYNRSLRTIADKLRVEDSTIMLWGETAGAGVQDLHYGFKTPEFRLFDVFFGTKADGRWGTWDEVEAIAIKFGIKTVPVLFRGKYRDYDSSLKNGNSTLASHVREGAVIKPVVPRFHEDIGRVILKDINEKYLTRKNGTEYN